jgi:hypothetical protein
LVPDKGSVALTYEFEPEVTQDNGLPTHIKSGLAFPSKYAATEGKIVEVTVPVIDPVEVYCELGNEVVGSV